MMRSNRRQTSSSYVSTITTVTFIALCVLAVWIFSSDSAVSPQSTTTHTASARPDEPTRLDEPATKNDDQKMENGGGLDEAGPGFAGKEAGEEHEKQNEQQIQISEDSVMTQKEKIQQNTDSGDPQNAENGQGGDEKSEGGRQEAMDEGKGNNDQNIKSENNEEDKPKELSNEPQQPMETSNITFSDETKKLEEDTIGSKDEAQQDQKSLQEPKQDSSTTEVEGGGGNASRSDEKSLDSNSLPNSGIPKESSESKKSWSTQATQSNNEKERRRDKTKRQQEDKGSLYGYKWQLCNVSVGPDYIPCLDNEVAVKKLRSTKHFEHREKHCPEKPPTCLVPVPHGYKRPIPWPQSRNKIWFHNVPHTRLAEVKGHQNWVKFSGHFLIFPGGGTQFIHGALHYIDFIEKAVPAIGWGKHTRVILDVGCGVASFGGYLFERDVLTMSFAPKDEHEAQVQFALERGIPAISAVMGSQRLPFPSGVFDLVHCARCRVPWHAEGGRLLLELNRVLRPGGYFVWSATPVYQKLPQDVEIWEAMTTLMASMCWKMVKKEKDTLNKIGAAIFLKPTTNDCYDQRKEKIPPMCKPDDDPNASWYVPLQPCMHRVPMERSERGSRWPENWPKRVHTPPYWLNKSQMGIYGRPAPDDFERDYKHWQKAVNKSYLNGLGISWSNVRNVMDMRAVYGGFAAALREQKIWVMNVVNVNSPDTLPIIYERGMFGIYHDWCESFNTYPRSYDLLHADHLFSKLKDRCKLEPVMAEIDRIVRPGGKLIARDESNSIGEIENLLKSLYWEVHLTFSQDQEGILSATKSDWRPKT